MAEKTHSDVSRNWLVFFFVCFVVVMGIGLVAIFTYNANAPVVKPAAGEHGSMILPQDDHRGGTVVASLVAQTRYCPDVVV